MRASNKPILLACLMLNLTACSPLIHEKQTMEAVGIFKSSVFDSGDWQHVATLHGWADDLTVCKEITRFLNSKEPGRYICRNL